ncbi:Ferric iron ABC transporter, iron-binding protein [hydrothermal vent metagenome]|uniref:Ferric iron ABC transporter, iron-binding protein n=1 Tax=hydrothermal vent metagenome TaxID=652676 RepID=A0A1W1CES8_9ZZZZ
MNLKKLLILLLFASCSNQQTKNQLIIYTSIDQVFSSKIIKEFKKSSGIDIKVLYDTEASKAVGLEKRLLAERKHPRADIFWNSEFMRMARLDRVGLFASYKKENLHYKKDYYHSQKDTWYGVGLRNRVFMVNKNLMKKEEYPRKLEDLTNPKYRGKVAMSMPYVGTTSTHFSALFQKMGEKKFRDFIQKLKDNKVALLAGNSVVKDAVGRGKYLFGLVDSDDALVGIDSGLPIDMVYYDQQGDGVFSIFGTVALLKNAPHPQNAKIFIDYLLTKEREKRLVELNAVQYGVLGGNESPYRTWSEKPSVLVDSLKQSVEIMKGIFE